MDPWVKLGITIVLLTLTVAFVLPSHNVEITGSVGTSAEADSTVAVVDFHERSIFLGGILEYFGIEWNLWIIFPRERRQP
jgi:hypothetical protein